MEQLSEANTTRTPSGKYRFSQGFLLAFPKLKKQGYLI